MVLVVGAEEELLRMCLVGMKTLRSLSMVGMLCYIAVLWLRAKSS